MQAPGTTDSDDVPPAGLRERRRLETERELSDAALELFERHGVHGTTVEDIARRAGTSPRTFFRYYASKEAAIFGGSAEAAAIARNASEAIRSGASVMRGIEASWLHLLERFDAHPEEHTRALRVRRLLAVEPSLLSLALRNESEQVDQLTDAAVDAAGADADALGARAGVSTLALVIRLTFDEWARRVESDAAASTHAIYFEIRRGVASFADDLSDAPPARF